MAVVNQYKFVGIDNDTTNGELNPFGSGNPFVSETYVDKLKAKAEAWVKNRTNGVANGSMANNTESAEVPF